MRELKAGTITLSITAAGRPATLRLTAGERISEARYKALTDEQKKRFKRVRPATTEAPDTQTDE